VEVIVFFWLACSILVGLFASIRRGRSGVGWFFISLIISPFFAGLLLLILLPVPPNNRPVRRFGFSQSDVIWLGILAFVVLTAIVLALITGYIGSHMPPL